MSKWIINLLSLVILGVWVASFIATLVKPGYAPPTGVQWAISVLAGAAFGTAAAKNSNLDKRDDD